MRATGRGGVRHPLICTDHKKHSRLCGATTPLMGFHDGDRHSLLACVRRGLSARARHDPAGAGMNATSDEHMVSGGRPRLVEKAVNYCAQICANHLRAKQKQLCLNEPIQARSTCRLNYESCILSYVVGQFVKHLQCLMIALGERVIRLRLLSNIFEYLSAILICGEKIRLRCAHSSLGCFNLHCTVSFKRNHGPNFIKRAELNISKNVACFRCLSANISDEFQRRYLPVFHDLIRIGRKKNGFLNFQVCRIQSRLYSRRSESRRNVLVVFPLLAIKRRSPHGGCGSNCRGQCCHRHDSVYDNPSGVYIHTPWDHGQAPFRWFLLRTGRCFTGFAALVGVCDRPHGKCPDTCYKQNNSKTPRCVLATHISSPDFCRGIVARRSTIISTRVGI